jgi:hypothetical protein
MDKIDKRVLFMLLIFFVCYATILVTNGKFSFKETKKVESLLDKKSTLVFEIAELIIIIGLIYVLYKQKQYILSLLFSLIFIEHINQILFCYRTDMLSTKVITTVMYITFLWYSYHKKCYWMIPVFMVALSFHVLSIIYNKSFSNVTCARELFRKK